MGGHSFRITSMSGVNYYSLLTLVLSASSLNIHRGKGTRLLVVYGLVVMAARFWQVLVIVEVEHVVNYHSHSLCTFKPKAVVTNVKGE